MSKRRKKKNTALPVVAASVIALTVTLIVLLIIAVAYAKLPEETKPSATTGTTNLSVPTVDDGTTSKPDDSDHPVTPQTTTGKTPETTPATTDKPKPATTEKVPETTPAPSVGVDYDYHIDMGIYEDYIDPTGDLWDDAYLLLVNADHTIGENAENGYAFLKNRTILSACKDYKFTHKPSIYLNDTALKALAAMFLEAEAQGITTLDLTSAYRDYAYQNRLFTNNCNKTYHWVCGDDSCNVDWIGKSSTCPICGKKTSNTLPITQAEKEANVATYSCRPGTSDHQTGLAVDIVQRSLPSRFNSLIQEFGETEAGKWLAANAHYFGFILRFPEDKEEITGIIYEPWHFRYVGRTHAMAMAEKNLCLEEYVEYLDSIGYFN